MKKYLALLSIVFFVSIKAYDRDVFAHSFMYTKPAYYDVVMEEALWHNIAYNKKGPVKGGLQLIPYYQQSMPLDKTTRYFLMKGKTELLVAGDDTPFRLDRDIRAEWVNLPSDFSGVLSVNPKQRQAGVFLEYQQDLKNWTNVAVIRDMFLTIYMPISETENHINLCQGHVTNPQATFPQDILEAFDQPDWCYSRISNHQKKQVGVAELRIKVGTSYISENYFQLTYYSVLGIPTGNKQNGHTMFQPVNGNNHHLGIGAGITMQAPMNRNLDEYAWCVFLNLESVILIRNKQHRTYDLLGKPWTRFVQVNLPNDVDNPIDIEETTDLPGVNFFTQKIYAKPFNVVDFVLGWRLTTQSFEGEIGYSIWGHPTERTNLNTPIKQPFGIAGSGPGKTASRSTIAQKAPDDLDFVAVTRFDLDQQTGESSGGFVQRAIMSAGWITKNETIDTALGVGASVDVPFETSILQLWKVWGKFAITF